MSSRRTGGCQCGEIRYEVIGPSRQLVVCHCTDCQRQSGSAFGMTLVVDESDLRLTRGEPGLFTSKSEAGRDKWGAFCTQCGTRIYNKTVLRPGKLSVKPGTLDDTGSLKPDIHIWTRSKQHWVTIPEGVETHEKGPS